LKQQFKTKIKQKSARILQRGMNPVSNLSSSSTTPTTTNKSSSKTESIPDLDVIIQAINKGVDLKQITETFRIELSTLEALLQQSLLLKQQKTQQMQPGEQTSSQKSSSKFSFTSTNSKEVSSVRADKAPTGQINDSQSVQGEIKASKVLPLQEDNSKQEPLNCNSPEQPLQSGPSAIAQKEWPSPNQNENANNTNTTPEDFVRFAMKVLNTDDTHKTNTITNDNKPQNSLKKRNEFQKPLPEYIKLPPPPHKRVISIASNRTSNSKFTSTSQLNPKASSFSSSSSSAASAMISSSDSPSAPMSSLPSESKSRPSGGADNSNKRKSASSLEENSHPIEKKLKTVLKQRTTQSAGTTAGTTSKVSTVAYSKSSSASTPTTTLISAQNQSLKSQQPSATTNSLTPSSYTSSSALPQNATALHDKLLRLVSEYVQQKCESIINEIMAKISQSEQSHDNQSSAFPRIDELLKQSSHQLTTDSNRETVAKTAEVIKVTKDTDKRTPNLNTTQQPSQADTIAELQAKKTELLNAVSSLLIAKSQLEQQINRLQSEKRHLEQVKLQQNAEIIKVSHSIQCLEEELKVAEANVKQYIALKAKEKSMLEQEIATLKDQQLEIMVFLQEAQKARLLEEQKRDTVAKELAKLSQKFSELKQKNEGFNPNTKVTTELSATHTIDNDKTTKKLESSNTDVNTAQETISTDFSIETKYANKSSESKTMNVSSTVDKDILSTSMGQVIQENDDNRTDETSNETVEERHYYTRQKGGIFYPHRGMSTKPYLYYPSQKRPYF
jgi:hypothetical protein